MFSEILRIKPKLDPGDAKRMEDDLSRRFGRVAKKFGSGLHAIARGSIIGISLGLLSRLLNPLEALEEKIKGLLGQGTDLRDLADRFGTTPGRIKQIEDIAHAQGVTPDQLKDLLTKFATSIEEARLEIQDPTATLSPKTQVLQNFVNQKDLAQGFFSFLNSLRDQGNGAGRDVFFGEREQRRDAERRANGQSLDPQERAALIQSGLLKHLSGAEARQFSEREVFGEVQHGAPRRLIETDVAALLAKLREPSEKTLSGSINKLATLADQQRISEVQRNTQDLVTGTGLLNSGIIAQMEATAKARQQLETAQLKDVANLERAANGIEEIKTSLQNITSSLTQMLGYLGELLGYTRKFSVSRAAKGLVETLTAPFGIR